MTVDERLNRIEHVTAGIAEERRKDREEHKALWRDTQQQIKDLARHVGELAIETRLADERLGRRIDELAAANQETDRRIRELGQETDRRIRDLMSAIGEMTKRLPPEKPQA